jgi:uncharacterized alkaline shock family protein YloU
LPDEAPAGQALATRRAVADIVRSATLGSYGVVGLGGNAITQLVGWLRGRPAGIRVHLPDGRVEIDLSLRVAHGVPIAEVARQVESAIRFAVRQALRLEVARLTMRVAGLEVKPASAPPRPASIRPIRSPELADSGTDVA